MDPKILPESSKGERTRAPALLADPVGSIEGAPWNPILWVPGVGFRV